MEIERRDTAPERTTLPPASYLRLAIDGLEYSCEVDGITKLILLRVNGKKIHGPSLEVGSIDDSGEFVPGLISEGKDLLYSDDASSKRNALGRVSIIHPATRPRVGG